MKLKIVSKKKDKKQKELSLHTEATRFGFVYDNRVIKNINNNKK